MQPFTLSTLRTLCAAALAACVAGPAAATSQADTFTPPIVIEPFEGRWATNHGELRLHQIRRDPYTYVIGDYAGRGILVGRVAEDGNCASGVFTNGERSGSFQFILDDTTPDRFGGLWSWHGEPPAGEWTGRRTGAAPDTLRNFARNGTTRTLPQDRAIMDGLYDSRYGMLDLTSRDLFVLGEYADKGVIAGMWDGNGFVGHFTNGGRTGWFDFDVLSKTGTIRGGQWGWAGEGSRGQWKPTPFEGARTMMLEPLEVGGEIGC
ncbi:hypothetical protein [Roseovarius salinarum]|uniref:hypothetical protein n=1 Tax=Roseovarius salinarum TaxID=1981892 RepID=UPI000C3347A4|nr:hypothetical protein [Roseovarius salinarum]